MDGSKDWLFPTTSVGAVVRRRPLALALFRRLGVDPWADPRLPLLEACRGRADTALLLRELKALPVPGPETPWRERPTYFLVDYLTAEHRDFLLKDLPAIRYLLDMGFPRGGESAFQTLPAAVDGFAARLRAHAIAEEEEIFPVILKNEHLLGRHLGPDEPGRGDDGAPAAGRLVDGDAALMRELEDFLEGAGRGFKDARPQGRPDAASDQGAGPLLRGLFRRLAIHARLETEILFPMAARMERELHSYAPA